MFCSNCGAENKDSSKFCESCGAQLKFSEKDLREKKNQTGNLFNQDPGRPVEGFEPKHDEWKDDTWETNVNDKKVASASGTETSNSNSAPAASNLQPQRAQEKKGMSTCCIVSLSIGIVVALLVLAIVILFVVFIIKEDDRPVVQNPTVQVTPVSQDPVLNIAYPTETPVPTEVSTASTNAVAMAFGSDVVREPLVKLKGNGEDTVTVMVYMNGSDLESESGEATTDLAEMIKAGSSDKVNVIVQTMGTERWMDYNISSKKTQIHELSGSGLKTVKELSQLDCTEEKTLSDFIIWTAQNYPADRYILLFWNHGGGPVYGFGYDQYNEEGMLTTDEIQRALRNSGVVFDFIGMDCCIMSSLEICCALYDYCDYMILSEDFESGLGWYYTDWLKSLYANPSISTPELAKEIVDDMILENEAQQYGDDGILALVDQSKLKVLYTAWKDFAYANEDALMGNNYSRQVKARGKMHPRFGYFSDWLSDESDDTTLSDYYITDIMALAQNIDSDESKALASAVNNTLLYVGRTLGDENLTGISVTLPYGDYMFYDDLKTILENCGFDSEYIGWLEKFVGESNYSSFYDYSDWDDEWSGWDDYEDDYNWYDWEYGYDDDYWYDDNDYWGWDDFDYEDSWNSWYYERDYDWDDWYWGDDYWYEDDWYDDWDW